jgi:mxaJ protein
MSSRFPERVPLRVPLAFAVLALCACTTHAAENGRDAPQERVLRVCADPDNLPYSKSDGSGFENRIAELVASDLGARVTYAWLPQRRGFVRKTLNERACDVIVGVPADYEPTRTTAPYYRSSYVFVSRKSAGEPYHSFDDQRLRRASIGVQLVGEDLAATPPGHVLAQRGITSNVIGFTVYGERPQAERMLAALAAGEIDVALLWGPPAAYFAAREREALVVSVAEAPADSAALPFVFAIAMGVRRDDSALQQQLDDVIARRRADIDAILRDYGVPRVDSPTASAEGIRQ